MAAAAPLRLVLLPQILMVVFGQPGQAELYKSAGSVALGPRSLPPSCEELTSSLVVNQVAILHIMEEVSNVSRVAVEALAQEAEQDDEAAAQAERLEAALRVHQERVLEAVEARQQRRTQEILEDINNKIDAKAQDTLTRVTELREEMRREVDRILEEVRRPEEPEPQEELPPHYATVVHNDTVPSMCRGSKFLVGSMGSLEVVKSGSYSSNVHCSWNITLPVKAPLSLDWDYLEMEDCGVCSYDWVTVDDLSNGGVSVYGRRLCNLQSSVFRMLDVVLPPTQNILVTFHSDSSNEYRGFRLNYRVVAP